MSVVQASMKFVMKIVCIPSANRIMVKVLHIRTVRIFPGDTTFESSCNGICDILRNEVHCSFFELNTKGNCSKIDGQRLSQIVYF